MTAGQAWSQASLPICMGEVHSTFPPTLETRELIGNAFSHFHYALPVLGKLVRSSILDYTLVYPECDIKIINPINPFQYNIALVI